MSMWHDITPTDILACAALLILGGLAAGMMYVPIPKDNTEPFVFVLGSISGALAVGSGQKLANKLTTPKFTAETTNVQGQE